ncbi:transcriptional regulator, PadR-like family, partial [mine drainage metagenome]
YMMSRGPIYGGELTQRIDDVTRGSWRPGAGAIYPILSGLVRRGEARLEVRDGRKVYSLTARGAARLKEVRSRIRERGGRFAELRGLILDMVEPSERAEILLDHLHLAIQPFVDIGRSPDGISESRERARVLARARAELRQGMVKLGSSRRRGTSRA